MDRQFTLTVEDILNRPLFKKGSLVAGKEGLNRSIRWVHIIQGCGIGDFLSGNEMILSTGARLKPDTEIDFLLELINQNVSCLLIELGEYINKITEEMINVANKYKFPLIVFTEPVRFIDLTQDVSSILVNQHHEMLDNFVQNSRQFHRLTLSLHATSQILRLLHNISQSKIFFSPNNGEPIFIPAVDSDEREHLKEVILNNAPNSSLITDDNFRKAWQEENKFYLLYPVGASGQAWGHLLMVIEGREPEENDYLILDSASISIAQDLLRKMYLEEKKAHAEHIWVADLIHTDIHDNEQISHWLPSDLHAQEKSYCICLFKIKEKTNIPDDSQESFQTHLMLLIRNEFKALGLHSLMTSKQNLIIALIVCLDSIPNQNEKIKTVLKSIELSMKNNDASDFSDIRFGVGKKYNDLTDVQKSYQEALSVLKINQSLQTRIDPFYINLGIYRILLLPHNNEMIKSFVEDTIGPLMQHDYKYNSEFIPTLQSLLKNDGLKQEAAKELHIARQTMYYRLNQIKKIIGDDFMVPERRISIEVALHALDILY